MSSYTRHTVEGYNGTMNSELVAVGNMPTAFFALMAELSEAGLPEDESELELDLCLWRVARTPAMTAPATMRIPTGTPNLIHLFSDLLGDGYCEGRGAVDR